MSNEDEKAEAQMEKNIRALGGDLVGEFLGKLSKLKPKEIKRGADLTGTNLTKYMNEITTGAQGDIARLEALVTRLDAQLKLNTEPALKLFDNVSGCGSEAFHKSVKSNVMRVCENKCAICGVGGTPENPVSVAHILPGNPAENLPGRAAAFACVNRPRFKDDYLFGSYRNGVVLCGTKSIVGSCHWAYDNHHVGIIYNPFSQKYEVFWFTKEYLQASQTSVETLTVSQNFNPQKRGFAFHAFEGLRRNGLVQDTAFLQRLTKCFELSLAGEEKKAGDSDSDSVATAGTNSNSATHSTLIQLLLAASGGLHELSGVAKDNKSDV